MTSVFVALQDLDESMYCIIIHMLYIQYVCTPSTKRSVISLICIGINIPYPCVRHTKVCLHSFPQFPQKIDRAERAESNEAAIGRRGLLRNGPTIERGMSHMVLFVKRKRIFRWIAEKGKNALKTNKLVYFLFLY